MTTKRASPPAGPAPLESRVSIQAWNLMAGQIDWAALPWVCDHLGIDDVDDVILDLMQIRDFQR